MLEQLIENDNFIHGKFRLIIDCLVKGDNDAANSALSEMIAKRGDEPCYLVSSIKGRVLFALGQTDLAIQSQEKARELGFRLRTVSRKARELGNKAFNSKQNDLALHYYLSAMMADPCDMRVSLNMAAIFLHTRNSTNAFGLAMKALRLGLVFGVEQRLIDKARSRAMAALEITGAQYRSNDLIEADFGLDWSSRNPAPEEQPDDKSEQVVYDAESDLGVFLFANGDYREAAVHFSAAISRRPAEAATYIERATCRIRLSDYVQGLVDANRAIGLKAAGSTGARAWLIKGLCQFGMFSCREARRSFEKANQMEPQNKLILNCLKSLGPRRHAPVNRVFQEIVEMVKVECRDGLIIP